MLDQKLIRENPTSVEENLSLRGKAYNISHIHELTLKKRRPSYDFSLSTIIDRTDGFSGAELEQAVIEGMHISFAENRALTEKDLIKAVSELVPLSRTAKEQIDLLKQWSSTGRARSAS